MTLKILFIKFYAYPFENCNSNLVATYPGTIAEFRAISLYNQLSNYAVVRCTDGDFTTKA